MKYVPLIWAALRRKPIRSFVTFLSVAVAFTLFGLTIGLDATLEGMAARAHADRAWTNTRFDTPGLPFALSKQIASLPGIKHTTVSSYIGGYVGDPKTRMGMAFVDDEYGRIFPDQAPQQQWDIIRHDHSVVIMNRSAADYLHKKVGDTFVLIANQPARADGTQNWPFKVGGIYEDLPQFPGPQIWGSYDYFNRARPLADQSKIDEVDFDAADPAQTPKLAERIDALYANSGNPTRTMTEKQAYAVGGNGGGIDVEALTRKIAAIGLFMILLLTANVIAQSVRERQTEFATLKTFGFSNAGLVALVMAEAAVPCLLGAGLGVGLAAWGAPHVKDLLPRGFGIPPASVTPDVILWALACALIVALASVALPVMRLSQLDVATALSRAAT